MPDEFQEPDSVLVLVDESPLSERAVEYGFSVFPDATFLLLTVIDPVTVLQEGAPEDVLASNWERWRESTASRCTDASSAAASELA